MKYFWIILIVAILLSVGLYGFVLKNQVQKLKPRVTGVRLAEELSALDFSEIQPSDIIKVTGELAQIDLDVQIEINNPTTREFRLYQVDLTLINEANGQIITRIRKPLESAIVMKPNSITNFSVPIRVNTLPLLDFLFGGGETLQRIANLTKLITGGFTTGKNLRLKGFARVQNNVFAIPINTVIKA